MNKKDKILGSYYIHVCNSGTTIGVRDRKGAIGHEIYIESGFFGLGSTEMVIGGRGGDYCGVHASDLRELAAMFTKVADQIEGK